ncbi:MAG: Spermidine/putrescine import ATP-binding protein PotA [Firmicutes bacterium ADurb.Bin099]|jgi:spermidine/putrescine transport system ATP-binding protein|nr:MAG: Spermidine/putrescine import ATP-binding protein PotA [Firmicutes bacterium ADurb.Bin099]HPY98299.1 ABC transporter ATP-binding protein [Clostridia bacterium]HQC68233.1 ABC transporter ATP-binding protein [Clostridia bacterium]
MGKKIIELKNIYKRFGDFTAIDGINLYINEGEFLTLLGPSGCGKTTTLRIIGGFEQPDEGDVLFEGVRINDVPAHKRPLNTVFQKYALFPHLTVGENVAFGPTIRKISPDIIQKDVKKYLEIVNLEGYEDRDVSTLSGGQQQRVAIARALINKPRVLLLDEPLGALDLKLRKDMQDELKTMHKDVGITFIYVTHDQEEALTLSDTVVVMNNGKILQIGTPVDIYNEPNNAFVAYFIGESNIIHNSRMVKDKLVNIDGVDFNCVDSGFGQNAAVDVVVRPEDVILVPPDKAELKGVVTLVTFKGVHYEIWVEGPTFEWKVHSTIPQNIGDELGITVDPYNIHVMKHEPLEIPSAETAVEV